PGGPRSARTVPGLVYSRRAWSGARDRGPARGARADPLRGAHGLDRARPRETRAESAAARARPSGAGPRRVGVGLGAPRRAGRRGLRDRALRGQGAPAPRRPGGAAGDARAHRAARRGPRPHRSGGPPARRPVGPARRTHARYHRRGAPARGRLDRLPGGHQGALSADGSEDGVDPGRARALPDAHDMPAWPARLPYAPARRHRTRTSSPMNRFAARSTAGRLFSLHPGAHVLGPIVSRRVWRYPFGMNRTGGIVLAAACAALLLAPPLYAGEMVLFEDGRSIQIDSHEPGADGTWLLHT